MASLSDADRKALAKPLPKKRYGSIEELVGPAPGPKRWSRYGARKDQHLVGNAPQACPPSLELAGPRNEQGALPGIAATPDVAACSAPQAAGDVSSLLAQPYTPKPYVVIERNGVEQHWAQPKPFRAHDQKCGYAGKYPRPRPGQEAILRVLRLQPAPLAVSDIATALEKERYTIALTLRTMEKLKLVKRVGKKPTGRNGKPATLWAVAA